MSLQLPILYMNQFTRMKDYECFFQNCLEKVESIPFTSLTSEFTRTLPELQPSGANDRTTFLNYLFITLKCHSDTFGLRRIIIGLHS
jgi:hypothetical protein